MHRRPRSATRTYTLFPYTTLFRSKREGSMRVVVGAAETQTPMLAGTIQWAILNPYWNVPDYLAQRSIAPKVLAGRSLKSLHMEALSDWGPNPRKLSSRSEEHTSELQSLMRTSYAVLCLKNKK